LTRPTRHRVPRSPHAGQHLMQDHCLLRRLALPHGPRSRRPPPTPTLIKLDWGILVPRKIAEGQARQAGACALYLSRTPWPSSLPSSSRSCSQTAHASLGASPAKLR
jgi:hypothetical protein